MGKVISNEVRKKISESTKGEKSHMWKGDEVGYWALHKWVYKHLGKAKICLHCGSEKYVEWANKSNEYKREITDWLELCRKSNLSQKSQQTKQKLIK